MKILIIFFMLCSISYAGEIIDSFEGLQSTQEDGVIIIDYAPNANISKLIKEAAISGQEAKVQWARIHRQQESDCEITQIKTYNINLILFVYQQ